MPDPIFENLGAADYQVTSKATEEYNCISWSVQLEDQVIWPDEDEQYSWPPHLVRSDALDSFIAFFSEAGFEVCQDAGHDPAREKVALYVKDGVVMHAARQLSDGNWTSKLGAECDIRHQNLPCLEGPYGQVVVYLQRPQTAAKPILPPLHPGPAKLVSLTGRRLF